MFKLVVLSVLFVAAVADPGALLLLPHTSFTSVVAPATTTITKSASSVVHPSPVVYSTPYAYTHFIKKRSPQYLAYNYAPTTYVGAVASYPYAAAPVLSTSVVHSPAIVSAATPLAYTAAHLIKKRSAPLFVAPTSYGAVSPLYATTYATAPVYSSPVINSGPLISTPVTYSGHFIKKRSAPLLTTYLAPSSFSQQSRVDITHGAPVLKYAPTTFYSQPY